MRQLSVAIGVAFVLSLGCAHGQDLKAAQACNRLGDDASRLACYDAAFGHNAALGAAKPPAAQQSGEGKVRQPAVGKTDASARFGDNGQLHPESKADLPKDLSAQVQRVAPLPNGLYRLTLDNGQVWRTTQADSAVAFQANDVVTISRRVLGGYEISLARHTASVNATRIK
jgi:hypothetical protein